VYRQPRKTIVISKRDIIEVLQHLYVKRVRYGFQLVKQYFLFSESDTSMHSNHRNLKDTVEEGIELLT
jgi:hypothetical protein